MTQVLFILLLAASIAFFAHTVWLFGRAIAQGTADPRPRLDQIPGRLMDVAVYFFGLKLGWFPLQHAYDTELTPGFNYTFLESAFRHAQLPILIIMIAFAGGWVLNMRTVMINTIQEDYVAMAQAKGLRDRRVMTRYAGRNAILPPLNGFAAQFATAVGGLVFIEFVFSYPGAGFTLQQAVLGNDYALAQALLVVLSVCVVFANLIMDALNLVLDPRVRAD